MGDIGWNLCLSSKGGGAGDGRHGNVSRKCFAQHMDLSWANNASQVFVVIVQDNSLPAPARFVNQTWFASNWIRVSLLETITDRQTRQQGRQTDSQKIKDGRKGGRKKERKTGRQTERKKDWTKDWTKERKRKERQTERKKDWMKERKNERKRKKEKEKKRKKKKKKERKNLYSTKTGLSGWAGNLCFVLLNIIYH